MTTVNPFDLLGDDDAEDPSQLIAAQKAAAAKKELAPAKTKSAAPAAQAKPAKLPSKPLPPSEAVREAKTDGVRGGGHGGGRSFGRGRGGGGSGRRDLSNDENTSGNAAGTGGEGASGDAEGGNATERRGYGGPRPYRGGRRGGFSNGEAGEGDSPRRHFERHSGTGRGYEMKRGGAGRGNWGTQSGELAEVTEEVVTDGKALGDEKPAGEDSGDVKESLTNESEEKEPEEKEMTLEEYEKLLEEKKKALPAFSTTEERKVDAKVFESMQQLSKKKDNDEIFAKLGSDKKKEAAEKEERAKKSVSINEFLKPAEGERNYNPGGRGRGRSGRGSRGFGGGSATSNVAAPKIEDPSHFPTLGAK